MGRQVGLRAGDIDLKSQHVEQYTQYRRRLTALKEDMESPNFRLEDRGVEICSLSRLTAYKKTAGTAADSIREALGYDDTV